MNRKKLYIILTLISLASTLLCIFTKFNLYWLIGSIVVLSFSIGGVEKYS